MSATIQFDTRSLGTVLASSQIVAVAAIHDGCIVFANAAFRMLFHADDRLLGASLASIACGTEDERLANALSEASAGPAVYFGVGHRADGQSFDLELRLESVALDGKPTVMVFAADVTGQHRSDERLAYLAYADALTGLPNRSLFADRLHQALLAAKRCRGVFGVLMIDLDGFKAVNDRYGHEAGDMVLRLVGQRFQGCIRESDTLARLGGDEFAVIVPRLESGDTAAAVAQRLIATLQAPIELGDQSINIGASVGIAVYPEHAVSVDPLLAVADAAMYQAKHAGTNQVRWAEPASETLLPVPPLRWSAAHAVGIREIDDQHCHMARLIDVVSLALKDGAEQCTVGAHLNELISFTGFHFMTEERLMAEHRVAGAEAHRNAHRRLLDDIRALHLDQDLPSISLMLRYLQEWLVRHVDGMDKELGLALITKGCR